MPRCIAFALVLAGSAAPALGQNWFHSPRTYDFATGEHRLAGDLDGDGDVDLVAFDRIPNTNSWWRAVVLTNDGVGNFAPGAVHVLGGDPVGQVLLADVTADGLLDLVHDSATNSALGVGVVVRPGLPGATFAGPQFTSLPGLVKGIASGDADADGDVDLLVAHVGASPGELRWLLPAGGGLVLGPAVAVPAGVNVRTVLAADLDGDLRADAVVVTAAAMHAFTTAASGALAGFGSVATATQFFGYATTGDLDGDLDDDVLVSGDFGPPTMLRNGGAGNWGVVPLPGAPGVAAGRVFAGDWDGDGDPDVLLRDLASGFAQWRNDGSAGFVLARTLPFGLDASRAAVGLHDVDGDGALDWIEARAVLFGDGSFHSAEPVLGAVGAGLRDVDQDGDLDRAVGVSGWQQNDATGAFSTQLRALPPPGVGRQWGGTIASADFDGDGREEFLIPRAVMAVPFAQFERMELLRDPGSGLLQDLGAAASGLAEMVPPAVSGDFDLDGDLDLVTSAGLWSNNGAGFFAAPVPIAGLVAPLAVGDVDGDGALDLVLGNGGGLPMQLARQTAPGVFAVTSLPVLGSGSPTLGDLDDDGDLDLLFDSATGGTTIEVHVNLGGSFVPALVAPWGAELGEVRVLAEDVDDDGRNDLVVSTGDRLHVFRRPGSGITFETVRSFLAAGLVEFGDVDLDGDRDAIGVTVLRSSRVRGVGAGLVRQYGVATAGTDGIRPLLGNAGPVRSPGAVDLRIRRGVGGAFAVLVIGTGAGPLPLPAFPGNTLQVGPIFDVWPLLLGGAPGAPAAGGLDLYVPVGPGLAGVGLFAQCVVDDPSGTSGLALSNALEVRFGP